MNSDKITIVTVCYNAEKEIEQTIKSVIFQTYHNLEYIIIDGGSTDSTMQIVEKYRKKIHVVISEPDNGIFDAMNKGLRIATGDWINFMNAGDKFADCDVVSKVFNQSNREYDVIYGDAYYVRSKGIELEKGREPRYIKRNMPNTHQSFFIRTNKAKKFGFDLRYRYASDYNMVYSIYMYNKGMGFFHLPAVICYYEAQNGFSMQARMDVQHEVLDIREHDLRWYYDMFKWTIKKMIGMK